MFALAIRVFSFIAAPEVSPYEPRELDLFPFLLGTVTYSLMSCGGPVGLGFSMKDGIRKLLLRSNIASA
jgi:hypothetical protein